MGSCGCGDFNADFRFPGPGDIVYVGQIYPPCEYCNTPAGIVLYAMGPEDCKDWSVMELPEIQIREEGSLIGIVHPEKVMQQVFEGIEQYINDGVNSELRCAVFDSRKSLSNHFKKLIDGEN